MSLTKEDKEEIQLLIAETLSTIQAGGEKVEQDNEKFNVEQQIENWEDNAIETGLRFKVAPADLELDGEKYFSWDRAKEIEEKYLLPKGWRLPTVAEWYLLVGRFGIDDEGKFDCTKWESILGLHRYGYFDDDDKTIRASGSHGYYWSSTASSASNAYYLGHNTSAVGPQYENYKYYGFSVRCVKTEW